MRVLTDSIAFENTHQRGVQRSFVHLWQAMAAAPGAADIDMISRRGTDGVPALVRQVREPRWHAILPGRSLRAGRAGAWRMRELAGRAAEAEVFHSTYFGSWPERSARRPAIVVTVHDMIPEEFGGHFDAAWREREVENKRRAMLQADLLLAVSRATADAVGRVYPELAGKVRIVHHGADHIGAAVSGMQRGPNALYVGDRAGYKNFAMVLEAMAGSGWPADVGLRIVGKPWRDDELALMRRLGLASRVQHLGRLNEQGLAKAYATSRCLVSPSLAEGFGFPVVEAQRQGLAVVCSDTPINHEIAADSVLFFAPRDAAGLASAVGRLQDEDLRIRVIENGLINAARFTWARCARETLAVYQEAIILARRDA